MESARRLSRCINGSRSAFRFRNALTLYLWHADLPLLSYAVAWLHAVIRPSLARAQNLQQPRVIVPRGRASRSRLQRRVG